MKIDDSNTINQLRESQMLVDEALLQIYLSLLFKSSCLADVEAQTCVNCSEYFTKAQNQSIKKMSLSIYTILLDYATSVVSEAITYGNASQFLKAESYVKACLDVTSVFSGSHILTIDQQEQLQKECIQCGLRNDCIF